MKNLACTFGRHRWTTHEEHGDVYNVCSRCGKLSYPPTADTYAAAQQAAAEVAQIGESGKRF